jgi:hypothetical protein
MRLRLLELIYLSFGVIARRPRDRLRSTLVSRTFSAGAGATCVKGLFLRERTVTIKRQCARTQNQTMPKDASSLV